jgi:Calcineurin-like phosphoesterase
MPTQTLNRESFFFPSSRRAVTPARKLAQKVATAGTHEPFGMSPRYHHWDQQRQNAPYRMDLADVLPARSSEILKAGKIVFHMVGDTGAAHNPGAQQNLADHMADQVATTTLPEQPSFFFHLGDIVYTFGEEKFYMDEFYKPYARYEAPIFAIPGNHDGYIVADSPFSLDAYLRHFCASALRVTPASMNADPRRPRPAMNQPNPYFRLNAPFVTILGLYSNTGGRLDDTASTEQQDWLAQELKDAPANKCLVIAVHHPPFSRGHHGNATPVQTAIDAACKSAKREPDAIFSGHVHNYERFTRKRGTREVPYVIAGAGGHTGYHVDPVDDNAPLPHDVKPEKSETTHPGFLRVSIDRSELHCEYHVIPPHQSIKDPTRIADAFILNWKTHKLQNL